MAVPFKVALKSHGVPATEDQCAIHFNDGWRYSASFDVAMAAAQELPNEGTALTTAMQFAGLNHPGHGMILNPTDFTVGNWDTATNVFSAGGSPSNAVEVIVRRSEQNGNPVDLLFARIFGMSQSNLGGTVRWIAFGVSLVLV